MAAPVIRSGAPTTTVPSSGKVTALHFRWEEKGTLERGFQPPSSAPK